MSLHLQAEAGLWLAPLLALLLAGGAFLLYRREVGARPPPDRWLLPALRALTVFLVVLMLLQPVLRRRHTVGQLARLRLLVDASQSMSVPDPDLRLDRKLLLCQRLGWVSGEPVDPELAAVEQGVALALAAAGRVAAAGGRADLVTAAAADFAAELARAGRRLERLNDDSEGAAALRRGTVLWEAWQGVTGGSYQELQALPDFPAKPWRTEFPRELEAPNNVGDSFGGRLRGYLYPPETGEYTFWVWGDDRAEFWLGPADGPDGRRLLCATPYGTGARQWDRYPEQKSAPVLLQAGRRYDIEVLYVENNGHDGAGVGWKLPGGTDERPIPGLRLAPAPAAPAANARPPGADVAARFRTELTDPAAAIAKRTAAPAEQVAEIARLAQLAAGWERDLRSALEFQARQALAGADAKLKDALRRFDETPRWQRVEAALLAGDAPLLRQLSERHDVELAALRDGRGELLWSSRAGRLRGPARPPAALDAAPAAPFTDLASPLEACLPTPKPGTAADTANPDEPRSAVILLSDGRDNTGTSPVPVARVLGSRGIPVFTVGVGAAAELQDMAIAGLEVPQSVFHKDRAKGRLHLLDTMPPGAAFAVRIDCGGDTLWEKPLESQGSGLRLVDFDFPLEELVRRKLGEQDASLRFTSLPLEVRVRIVDLAGDREPRNNEALFPLRATLAKYRVLLLEGRPRWEWRYIRNTFDRDEQWQCTSVLVDWTEAGPTLKRAPPAAPAPVPREPAPVVAATAGAAATLTEDLPPGAFPADRAQLFTYDVVILGEVPAEVFTPDELEWLREFAASRGGGVVLVDGRHGLLKPYENTRLRPLLPVEWAAAEAEQAPTGLRIPPAGTLFPPLALLSNATENAELWSTLPAPQWAAPVTALPGTETVLEFAEGEDRRSPALVTRRYGAGRVVYAAFDESWRLRYRVGNRHNAAYWNQLARWVMEPPFAVSDRQVALDTGPLVYRPGQAAEFRVRLRDEKGEPMARANATLELSRDGRRVARIPLLADENGAGLFRATSAALEPGRYEATVRCDRIPESAIKVRSRFVVAAPDWGELAWLGCNEPLLQQVAAASGAAFVREEGLDELTDRLKPLTAGQVVEQDLLLWQSYWWFVPIVLLLTGEWIWRKRRGLL